MNSFSQRFGTPLRKAFAATLIFAYLIQPLSAFADDSGFNFAPSNPSISGPTSGQPNNSYTFNASASDPEGDQISFGFDWDNDGVVDNYSGYVDSGSSAFASHSWSSNGNYTVSVVARDVWGQYSGFSSQTISISSGDNNPNPNPNTAPSTPRVSAPSTVNTNTPANFTATASDPQGDSIVYGFDWDNNGTIDEFTGAVSSGASASVSHSWSGAGTYTVQVFAKDMLGATSGAASATITVTSPVTPPNNPPQPVNVAPTTPLLSFNGTAVNSDITFTATSQDADGDQINYGFDWDNDGVIDGNTGYVPSGFSAQLSHNWSQVGTYIVNAYARDIWGHFSSAGSVTINVSNTGPVPVNTAPNLPVVGGSQTGTVNVSESFTVTSSDPQGDSVSYGFDWDNNGVIDEYSDYVASGQSVNAGHTWSTVGTQTFQVYAEDVWGAVSTAASFTIVISGPVNPPVDPRVNLAPRAPTITSSGSAINSNVTFTATATDPENDQLNYGFDWDNDGVVDDYTGFVPSGVSAQLSHVWSSAGTYTVTVFARDVWGHISSGTSVSVVITSTDPTPVNTAPNVPVVGGNTASLVGVSENFTLTASDPQGDDLVYGVDWNNDGEVDEYTNTVDSGISQVVSHVWNEAGVYSFKVYARDVWSAVSSPAVFTITISSPVVNLPPTNPSVMVSGSTINSPVAFTVLSTDPEGDQISYGFDWDNDGVIDEYSAFTSSGVSAAASHVWTSAGTYTVKVYAKDNLNHFSGATTIQVTINGVVVDVNTPPTAPTVAGPTTGLVNTSHTFVFTSTDAQNDNISYGVDWDNNGGIDEYTGMVASGVSASLSRSFSTAGVYTFTAYAKDSRDALSNPSSFTITITTPSTGNPNQAPTVELIDSPAQGLVNTSYSFTARATDPDNNNVSYAFDWDNDGVVGTLSDEQWSSDVSSGTSITRSNSWSTSGIKTFRVFARDTQNAQSSVSAQIVITGGPSNDHINFTVSPASGLTTSEAGATAAFTVVLDSAPMAPVELAVKSNDLSEGTTAPLSTLTFSTTNWAVPQTIVVSGIDDSIDDGDITYSVQIGPAVSNDINWNNLGAKAVSLVNIDNDGSGGGGNDNPGSVSSFTANPATITSGETSVLSWVSTNATACVASGAWSGYKSLTGTETVTPPAASETTTAVYMISCGNQFGTSTSNVSVTVNPRDGGGNNNPGTITSYGLNPTTITSGGTSTLSWASSNASLCQASGAWSGFKNLSGFEVVGPFSTTTTSVLTFTLDCGNQFGTSTQSATLTVNPTPGGGGGDPTADFTITPTTGLVTSEGGLSTIFKVFLNKAPLADVMIPVVSSDTTEGTTSTTTLIFTPANWNLEQTVTVTGIDDSEVDGNIAYSVTVGSTTSSDATWNGLAAKIVSITNTDNDNTTGGGGGGGGSGGGGGRGGGGGGNNSGPCYGFNCPATTTPATTGGNGGNGIIITYPVTPTTSVRTGPENVCATGNYITVFMRIGGDNAPSEVRKLQTYLNTYENAGLEVTGTFDVPTETAVKNLQSKYASEILAPWGVTEPTGIVYLTTTRHINTVTCADSIKDNVLYPEATTTDDFTGLIGLATSTPSGDNLALLGILKDIPWYALLIILLIIVGTTLIISGILRKDRLVDETYMTFIRGSAFLAVGTVLNVLNSVSYILNPLWFTQKTGLTLTWLIGLDIFNLLALITICFVGILNLYSRSINNK